MKDFGKTILGLSALILWAATAAIAVRELSNPDGRTFLGIVLLLLTSAVAFYTVPIWAPIVSGVMVIGVVRGGGALAFDIPTPRSAPLSNEELAFYTSAFVVAAVFALPLRERKLFLLDKLLLTVLVFVPLTGLVAKIDDRWIAAAATSLIFCTWLSNLIRQRLKGKGVNRKKESTASTPFS